jgi:hypothetical protein
MKGKNRTMTRYVLISWLAHLFSGVNCILCAIISPLGWPYVIAGILIIDLGWLVYTDTRPEVRGISVAIAKQIVLLVISQMLAFLSGLLWIMILYVAEVVATFVIIRIKFGPRKRRKKRQ